MTWPAVKLGAVNTTPVGGRGEIEAAATSARFDKLGESDGMLLAELADPLREVGDPREEDEASDTESEENPDEVVGREDEALDIDSEEIPVGVTEEEAMGGATKPPKS
jgi:hypothetical protein